MQQFGFSLNRKNVKGTLFAVVAIILLLAFFQRISTAHSQSPTGSWTLVDSTVVFSDDLAVLQDGKVLAVGRASNVTELYNPATRSWSTTGNLNTPRVTRQGDLIRLNDGRVFIAGGQSGDATTDFASTEIYNPATGTWSYSGNLNTPRRYATYTLLNDGRILAVGGAFGAPDNNRYLSSVEIFDPATGNWTFTNPISFARESHNAIRLADGRVLIYGGVGIFDNHTTLAQIFDPTTQTWSAAGDVPFPDPGPGTLLPNGKVLVVPFSLTTPALYDPTTNTWSLTNPMSVAHGSQTSVLLADGQVLVPGGYNNGSLSSTEFYDPSTNIWSLGPSLKVARAGAIPLRLQDNSVLLVGGANYNVNPGVVLNSCELFQLTTTFSISGSVVDAQNNPVSGVSVSNGAGDSKLTDSNGNYSFSGLASGSYTITPSKTGFTFTPTSRTLNLTGDLTGVNFVAGSIPASSPIIYPFQKINQTDPTWKIITGYNTPSPSDHNCNLADNCYGRYAFDFVPETGFTVDQPVTVTAPVSGKINFVDTATTGKTWDVNSPNCMSIKIDGYADYYLIVCHIEFDKIYHIGDSIVQGNPIGKAGNLDVRSSQRHIHMALYTASDPAAKAAQRTGVPFANGWGISGCNYPENGTPGQYIGLIGLPDICSTLDTIPPTTAANTTPTSNTNGWNNTDVTVTLTATDNAGGSGAKEIIYSAVGAQTIATKTVMGSSASVSTTFKISAEGQTTITYFARDRIGNTETAKTLVIRIDKTAPEFDLYYDQQVRALKLITVDKLSGAATDPITIPNTEGYKTYELKDMAGNSLNLTLHDIGSDVDTFAGVEFKKMIYNSVNNSTTIDFENPYKENSFKVDWSGDTGQPITNISQSFSLQKAFQVKANYQTKKNTTAVNIKEQGKPDVNRTDTGFTVLHAFSNSGKLNFALSQSAT